MVVRREACTACVAGTVVGATSALCLEEHAFYALVAGGLLIAVAVSAKPILPVLAMLVLGSKGPSSDEQRAP
jgi:hypothetical protein